MQEALQRALAWAKANPVLAGGLVIGGAILAYFLIKGVGSGAGQPTPLTTDDIGSGGGVGGDDVVPIAPMPEILLPEPGFLGSSDTSSRPSGPVSFAVSTVTPSSIIGGPQYILAEAAKRAASRSDPSATQPQANPFSGVRSRVGVTQNTPIGRITSESWTTPAPKIMGSASVTKRTGIGNITSGVSVTPALGAIQQKQLLK